MKIGVFHQNLIENPGGAASVAAWICEALKKDYDVTLITYGSYIDFKKLNDFYGTSLTIKEIKINFLPLPRYLRKISPALLKSVRLAYAIRALKKIQKEFDILITTINEVDLPLPSIQYIHCPVRSRETIKRLYSFPENYFRNMNNLIFKIISGFRETRFKNTTHTLVVNSEWTANLVKEIYGIDSIIIYPPVIVRQQKETSWHDRENGLVMISRLLPEKRIEDAIYVVNELKKFFPDMHLHIIGTGSTKYAYKIKNMVKNLSHIFLHENVNRNELIQIVKKHKYGIHPAKNEHLGIAPAEMLLGGCIVFVHNSGGQVEIVSRIKELIFNNVNDAVKKIKDIHVNQNLQSNILALLNKNKKNFSPDNFLRDVKKIISKNLLKQ